MLSNESKKKIIDLMESPHMSFYATDGFIMCNDDMADLFGRRYHEIANKFRENIDSILMGGIFDGYFKIADEGSWYELDCPEPKLFDFLLDKVVGDIITENDFWFLVNLSYVVNKDSKPMDPSPMDHQYHPTKLLRDELNWHLSNKYKKEGSEN